MIILIVFLFLSLFVYLLFYFLFLHVAHPVDNLLGYALALRHGHGRLACYLLLHLVQFRDSLLARSGEFALRRVHHPGVIHLREYSVGFLFKSFSEYVLRFLLVLLHLFLLRLGQRARRVGGQYS